MSDQKRLDLETGQKKAGPVECLGLTFESDAARGEYFLAQLAEKLKDPEFRSTPGFPKGSDEAILQLSDPPYYTACPNPFVSDYVSLYGQPLKEGDDYQREPLAVDVSEGKNDPIYRLPSYQTKVPPRAIAKYILHYTRPGDLVLDAFCGTGMTGVAARSLAREDPTLTEGLSREAEWGARRALLFDLSPTATFVSGVMNSPMLSDLAAGSDGNLARWILSSLSPMYASIWGDEEIPFEYAIWTDWGDCSECGVSFPLIDSVVDWEQSKMRPAYPCPSCGAELRSRSQEKTFVTEHDPWLDRPVRMAKTTLALISRRKGRDVLRRKATEVDSSAAVRNGEAPVAFHPQELPYAHLTHERNNLPRYWGVTHVHQLYTRRNYSALSRVCSIPQFSRRRAALFAVLTILDNHATRRNRFYVDKRRPRGSPVGPLSNTLYIPTLQVEANLGNKLVSVFGEAARLQTAWPKGNAMVSTQSATDLGSIPPNTVDFVFTDPPFGGNIHYSEQNFLSEWWLRVFTNNDEEAITNTVQQKGLLEYESLMTKCFSEYHRVLKPGRWIVVEFHNSNNSIWIAIQNAMQAAGFVVAAVNILDKKQATLHQDHKTAAVEKDLAISAYKPSLAVESKVRLAAEVTDDSTWPFVLEYLASIPLVLQVDDQLTAVAERTPRVLFDRLVAFHVQRGRPVPVSAGEFYVGLADRFPERDGMYFLPEQIPDYEKKRAEASGMRQLELFVSDEASAIEWLTQQLGTKPQTFQELQPGFIQAMHTWANHEKTIELQEMLLQNFLKYDGVGPVPGGISERLSSAFPELQHLALNSPELRAAIRDKWYLPDSGRREDLERLRERALLSDFQAYVASPRARLKNLRTEAVRTGFRACYAKGDYETIILVSNRIPDSVLKEDETLLMYYDVARTRLRGDDPSEV